MTPYDEIGKALKEACRESKELQASLRQAENRVRTLEEDLNEELISKRAITDRLREAADLLAQAGLLVDTPHSKSRWVTTGEGVVDVSLSR